MRGNMNVKFECSEFSGFMPFWTDNYFQVYIALHEEKDVFFVCGEWRVPFSGEIK
jgi:hypothetical protein